MAPRRRRSKKRSAASSLAKRLDAAVFYLDESIYSRALEAALLAAGVRVEHAGPLIPIGSPDEFWLTEAGTRGWIVLSRDQRIRYRELEHRALRAAGVAAFVFTGGQATARDTATVLSRLVPKLVKIATSEPRPFIYAVGHTGTLRRL
jgi:hypothetical protein